MPIPATVITLKLRFGVGDIVGLGVYEGVRLGVPVFDAWTDGETEVEACRDCETDVLGVLDELPCTDADLEPVAVIDVDSDILRLNVELTVSVGSVDGEAVIEAVKLGDTGLFVTDGVGVDEGIISVYDMKKADPRFAILTISVPIWLPLPS